MRPCVEGWANEKEGRVARAKGRFAKITRHASTKLCRSCYRKASQLLLKPDHYLIRPREIIQVN